MSGPDHPQDDPFDDRVRRHLHLQEGIVTRGQLLEAGVTKGTIRWRAGRDWRVALPRVYAIGRDPLSPRQREIAALLWAGPRAAITAEHALAFYGLRDGGGPTVAMLTSPPATSRRHGFAAVRQTLVEDHGSRHRGPLRYTSPARALVEAALRANGTRERSALLVAGVQRGLTSVDDLHELVCRLRTRDAAKLLAPLDHAASGAWSLPEAELLDLVATSSLLPEPWANPTLVGPEGERLLTPDLWFDDVAVAILVHSHLHHAQGEQWVRTVEQDGELTRRGVVVLAVTPTGMRLDPGGTLRRLEQTHEVARQRPRPAVVATPRPTWLAS